MFRPFNIIIDVLLGLLGNTEQRIKINRLAMLAFVTALIPVLAIALWSFLIAIGVQPAPGHYSPLTGSAGPLLMLAVLAMFIFPPVAFIVGLIATILLLRRKGTEKGMVFALSGLLISSVLIGVLWIFDFSSSPQRELKAQVSVVQGKLQGPFIIEDLVVPLDLTGVSGDSLQIRINPPIGFWAIDYLGIEYSAAPAPPTVTEVPIAWAEDQYGKNVAPALSAIDKTYQVLPVVGDWAKVQFTVPPEVPGMQRSVFLKTTGYYEIHLPKDQPEQTSLVHEIMTIPGWSVEFSLEKYLAWRGPSMSAK